MAQVLARVQRIPRLSRFGWLMALYAENQRKLERLFKPGRLEEGSYVSRAGQGPSVRVDVVAQHAYTTELRISYELVDPVSGCPDPSAHVRLYRDARQAEATHCYIGHRWQDVIGMYPPPSRVLDHRMRMNTFLGKWLDYLAEQGHGVATLRRECTGMPAAVATMVDRAG